jgi:DDE_Tnp_1-associated
MELLNNTTPSRRPHPLMPSSLIAALRPNLPADIDVPDLVDEPAQRGLLEVMAAVPDPRDPRGVRYQLASLLAVAVCAVLAGVVTFAAIADWAVDLDPDARQRHRGRPGPIAVGREGAARGTVARGRQVHLLAGYATGLVLAQQTIASKSDEIPAFAPLLDQVEADAIR